MRRREHLDVLATSVLMACCAAWGLNQVAIKVAIGGISPVFGAGLRSLLAGACLWLWCGMRGQPLIRGNGTGRHGLFIGLMFAAEFVFLYWGLAYTTASRSVIFLYSAPFFVAVGAHYFIPGERLTVTRMIGLLLAFGGLCLAFAHGLALPGRRALLGDMLELVAGGLWGATTVVIKRARDLPITPEQTLFYQLGISGLVLTVLAWAVGEPGVTDATPLVLLAFAYQTIVVAFASYLTWFWLLAHYPASGLAALTFWTPIFGVLAGGVLLGDVLTGRLLVGVGLVAGGIYLVNRRSA